MDTFKERLDLALSKFDLKKEVQKKVVSQCQQEGLHILAGISLTQLEKYAKQVVLAAWLDDKYEVDGIKLSWIEQKSELTERAMTDITKLLRLKALNKLK